MAKTTVTPSYVAKLETALRERFGDGAGIRPEHVTGDRYRFVVYSPTFNGKDHADRQEEVWAVVDSALDRSEVLKVSMILAISDDELYDEED